MGLTLQLEKGTKRDMLKIGWEIDEISRFLKLLKRCIVKTREIIFECIPVYF